MNISELNVDCLFVYNKLLRGKTYDNIQITVDIYEHYCTYNAMNETGIETSILSSFYKM